VNELKSGYDEKIESIINGYEEKLSNVLIHSNAQNTRLTYELTKSQLDNDQANEKIRELVIHIDSQNSEFENLTAELTNFQIQLRSEAEKFLNLTNEFDVFKQNSSLTNSEHVNELNSQIENLNSDLGNLTSLFETTTNTLGETEITLELKNQELENASLQIESLNSQISSLESSISLKEIELEGFKSDLESSVKQQILDKEIEFQKLLVENSSLICDIDAAQDKVEAQEAELALIKAELEEIKTISAAKVDEFKEILSEKNFTITNLEGQNAGLTQEISQLKSEVSELQAGFDTLNSEKLDFLTQLTGLQSSISDLNSTVASLNDKIASYESEIQSLSSNTAVSASVEEQDAFIDRLFKQIDGLNDERLVLLDEKEQMATQLLKMNDVIGELSQNIESQSIDVTDLNNHRKNIILANNSGEKSEKSQMKKQINDLVREIDKCITLLSA
jgi:chromosome segregation ATPase